MASADDGARTTRFADVGWAEVSDLLRRHHSSGRVLLHEMQGIKDVEWWGDGSRVWGRSGRPFLDFGAVGMLLFGHDPVDFLEPITAQLGQHATMSRTMPTEITATACARLAALAPDGLDKVAFYTSGTEATEAALRLVRAATGRSLVGHLDRAYHGKTLGAMAVSDLPWARSGAGPDFDEATSFVLRGSDPGTVYDSIVGRRPAGVIVEPIQGEGGIRVVADEVLQAIRDGCDRTGALLIVDEIQSGLGRSGRCWAIESSGVTPDVLLSGKALGGGILPVSAVIATPRAFVPMDLDPFLQASTYGGYPLGCAAVIAAVDRVEGLDWESLAERAEAFDEHLHRLAETNDLITDVPGRGLMRGIEFAAPPIAGLALRACAERGLLLSPCLSTPRVARLYPPVSVTNDELDEMSDIVNDAMGEVAVEAATYPTDPEDRCRQ